MESSVTSKWLARGAESGAADPQAGDFRCGGTARSVYARGSKTGENAYARAFACIASHEDCCGLRRAREYSELCGMNGWTWCNANGSHLQLPRSAARAHNHIPFLISRRWDIRWERSRWQRAVPEARADIANSMGVADQAAAFRSATR